jgi:hypothetical protein
VLEFTHPSSHEEKSMARAKFDYDVFISYSHKDEDWVRGTLLPTLEKQGLKVCIDYRDFAAGKAAVLNMQEASARSRHTLLVLTSNWLSSEWTLYESLLSRSEDPAGLERRTIPLMVKRCTPPPFLSLLTWVDFSDPKREKEAWQSLFRALNKKVERLAVVRPRRGKTEAAPAEPESAARGIQVNIGKDVKGVAIVGDGNTVIVGQPQAGKQKKQTQSKR